MTAATRPTPSAPAAGPLFTTMLALVQSVQRDARSEDEVVETVAQLVNSGRAVLTGNFSGQRLELS